MELGTNIKTMRIVRKIKQKELARKVGITQNYLSMVENNAKKPSLSLIERLARALEIPLHHFFTDLSF